MNLNDFSMVLLFAAAIISVVSLVTSFFGRSRREVERSVKGMEERIQRKKEQLPARQKEAGELREERVKNEISEMKRRILGGEHK